MITTIREQIEMCGRSLQETTYNHWMPELLDFPIAGGKFYEWKEDGLCYKSIVSAVTPEDICEQLPEFGRISFATGVRQPYFVHGLDKIRKAKEAGRPIAIEGGPCLFGTEEVDVYVRMKDGRTLQFDYSSGTPVSSTESLDDFLMEYASEILDISFTNHKEKLTSQEWNTLRFLFEAASALDAKLVLSLPDMSYCKYLVVPLEGVTQEIRMRTLERFREIAYQISDLYIRAIHGLKQRYPKVDYVIFHERERALCELFYDKRIPYVESKKALNMLTRSRERIEYVKDYTALPALPYYLYGITDILEINSLYEADSVRKCMKLHKSVVNMAALLFVEKLSADQVHVIYDAKLSDKEYVEWKDC